jgi:hypothetical protein
MEANRKGYAVLIPFLSRNRAPAGRGIRVLVPILSVFLGSCDVTPEYLRQGLQEQRLEEVGLPEVDPSGTSSSAGVSLLRKFEIRPLNPRKIGSDTTSQGFHRYVHRCGTCHAAPDPSLRTASEWKYAFRHMEKHLQEAGLIPLGPLDKNLILGFLERHAAEK